MCRKEEMHTHCRTFVANCAAARCVQQPPSIGQGPTLLALAGPAFVCMWIHCAKLWPPRETPKNKKKQTINKATNQATNMTANRTATLAANMGPNVTANVTVHKATSMVQGIGQNCIRVRTWLHASHHCGKLELSLTNDKTITYHEKGFLNHIIVSDSVFPHYTICD